MNQAIEAAHTVGSAPVNVQVWVLIFLGILAVVWAVRAFRNESAELRKDLREQAVAREVSLRQLITCVESNTAVLKENSEVLAQAKYQLLRNQETLDKFTS